MNQYDWGRVSVSGTDTVQLLQGQLTQDVAAVGESFAPLAAWCSPQGRILALCRLLAPAAQRIELLMPAELTAGVARRLGMYVLRARATVRDEGGGWRSLTCDAAAAQDHGLQLPEPAGGALFAHDCWWVRLPGSPAAIEIAGTVQAIEALALAPEQRRSRVECGLPQVVAATQEAFIPQMLNLDALGGVNFRKGCYVGQEIVARTQNLGRIKRRMACYQASASLTLAPGDRLLAAIDDSGESAAQVVECEGTRLLAVVRLEHAGRPLYGAGGEQLLALPLPYPVAELQGS
jgi:folate-binding protein YgfZ